MDQLTVESPMYRATVFLYRFCPTLIADLVVPPIVAALMTKDVWIPLLLSVGISVFATLLAILFVPETLPISTLEEDSCETNSSLAQEPGGTITKKQKFTEKCRHWIRGHISAFSFVTRHASIWSLVFTFLISKIGRQSSNVIFQYVSKRYDWSLAQVCFYIILVHEILLGSWHHLTTYTGRASHVRASSGELGSLHGHSPSRCHVCAVKVRSYRQRSGACQRQHSSLGAGSGCSSAVCHSGRHDYR